MGKEKRRRKEGHRKEKKKRRRRRSRSSDSSTPPSPPSPHHLLMAAAVGDRQRCRQLVQQGADVAYADAEGTTALHEVSCLFHEASALSCSRPVATITAFFQAPHSTHHPRTPCNNDNTRPAGTDTCPLHGCC